MPTRLRNWMQKMYLVSHNEWNDWRGRVLTEEELEDGSLFWQAYLTDNWVFNPS